MTIVRISVIYEYHLDGIKSSILDCKDRGFFIEKQIQKILQRKENIHKLSDTKDINK